MTHKRIALGAVGSLAVLSMMFFVGSASSHSPTIGVVPQTVNAVLPPGGSLTVNKTVHTTPIPPLIDIVLLEDETGSFGDDIDELQNVVCGNATPPPCPGGPLITALTGSGANYATAVYGFRDFAQDSWGSTGDWVVRRLADVTAGGAGFIAGAPSLTAGGGNDGPEGDLEALHYMAVTAHPAIDSNGDADTTDANDTAAGLQPSWRPLAKRVILLATDAPCHVMGDAGGWPGDAGTTSPTVTAGFLNAAGITVIGLTPGGAGTIPCIDTLASLTGGSVQATTASGSTIGAAIVAGLNNLAVTVGHVVGPCDPNLTVNITPATVVVTSGDDAPFTETISVSPSATPGSTLLCTVSWTIDGNVPDPRFVEQITIDVPKLVLNPPTDTNEVGTQHTVTATVTAGSSNTPLPGQLVSFSITAGPNAGQTSDPPECTPPGCTTDASGNVSWTYTSNNVPGTDVILACFTFADNPDHTFCNRVTKKWVDTQPPKASCTETTNPAGKNVPPAGNTTLPGPRGGQNEDGFYLMTFSDNVAVASAVIQDSASSFNVAVANGEKDKITQAPGATPGSKPMAGVITKHITLKGDALLVVTDTSGNTTTVSCKVPPPPK